MPKQAKKSLIQSVRDKLKEVLDPELGVSIVDLGLVYDISVDQAGACKILMTLTTIGCPLFGQIQKDIEDRAMEVDGVEDVSVELTFDPPWTPDKMTKETRIRLGLD